MDRKEISIHEGCKIYKNCFIRCFIIFLIILGSYIVFVDVNGTGESRAIIIMILAGLSGLIGNIHRLTSMKAFLTGFEAKMREASEVIGEAKASAETLQELAVMMGCSIVDAAEGAGRYSGSMTIARNAKRKKNLEENLKRLALSPEQLDRVLRADQFWISFDYMRPILQPAGEMDSQNAKFWHYDFAEFMNRGLPLTPDECEAFLSRHEIVEPDRRTRLRACRYYLEHNQHLTPELDRAMGN